jgi:hypothetical protein
MAEVKPLDADRHDTYLSGIAKTFEEMSNTLDGIHDLLNKILTVLEKKS